ASSRLAFKMYIISYFFIEYTSLWSFGPRVVEQGANTKSIYSPIKYKQNIPKNQGFFSISKLADQLYLKKNSI
ncbi:hypothetical protein, partial [uncultured Traorella sp.]|uniref:hypothetical protein n=1 Tax=uncultured Traorella sp. TaxID=1929048 RepID=UPI0025D2FE22